MVLRIIRAKARIILGTGNSAMNGGVTGFQIPVSTAHQGGRPAPRSLTPPFMAGMRRHDTRSLTPPFRAGMRYAQGFSPKYKYLWHT
jgi:hypothetical protein